MSDFTITSPPPGFELHGLLKYSLSSTHLPLLPNESDACPAHVQLPLASYQKVADVECEFIMKFYIKEFKALW